MTISEVSQQFPGNNENILRGHYQIIKQKGRGTFGITYEAIDLDLPDNHKCIVKHLKPSSSDSEVIKIATRLFQDESKHLYKLGKHDRIPSLFARFEENDRFYLVQEYIDGENLATEITNNQPWNESIAINNLREILSILAVVHRENIIHRDVKPDNIIRRSRDRKLVLIDFGAVKEIIGTTLDLHGQPLLTVCIGPSYMPDEQRRGMPVLASDIYAVGIICILGLTGSIDTNNWRSRVSSTVSDEFAEIIDLMTDFDWQQRYQNASEALAALDKTSVVPISNTSDSRNSDRWEQFKKWWHEG